METNYPTVGPIAMQNYLHSHGQWKCIKTLAHTTPHGSHNSEKKEVVKEDVVVYATYEEDL